MTTATRTPTPDGVSLHFLPCGRTLVEDTHIPIKQHRWVVLRPGWQSSLERWRDSLDKQRRYAGSYYLSWWSALATGKQIVTVDGAEMDRLIGLATGRN